jgi:hypothetical protein
MATLLLSSIGTAVGGPIGGLIGAVAGRTFDTQVLGLGNRRVEGARQENLDVQSGSYGGTIPLIFGTGRYAGNVIWSTGLLEAREEETQGGKGGPSVTTVRYSYSASFAVGICAGPIQSIGRVWADGKLIRSAGDALSVGGTMRLYTGAQDQLPDPLIEGDVGLDSAPAFRALAYAVFEAMPLAEFGNRIPNLSFEVIQSEAVTIGTIAEHLLAGAGLPVVSSQPIVEEVGGYQVSGSQSYRDGLGVLLDMFDMTVLAGPQGLSLQGAQATPHQVIGEDALGARPAQEAVLPRLSVDFDHALDLPSQVTVGFADPATDYQKAVQHAMKVKAGGEGSLTMNTAMTLSAAKAQSLAVQTLSKVWDERLVITLEAGLEASQLDPGDLIRVATPSESEDVFEITHIAQSEMVTSITARTLWQGASQAHAALPGYSGETTFQQSTAAPSIDAAVFELPATAQFGANPSIYAAVTRTGGRLNSAGLYVSRDNGVNFDLAAQVPASAVTGVCLNGLADRSSALFDHASALEVALDSPEMALASRPKLAILNGANLALVGNELLQFQNAELQESGTYLLTGLLRGRAGTQASQMGPSADQKFILLSRGDLASQAVAVSDVGTGALYKFVAPGTAIAEVPVQTVQFEGRALKPLAPVFLRASQTDGGDIEVSWVRCSRTGFGWVDGADAPVGEDTLAFRITYSVGGQSITRDISDAQSDVITAATLASTFGPAPFSLSIEIAQLSSAVGPGRSAATQVLVA